MGQFRRVARDLWDYEVDLPLGLGFRMPSRSTVVRLSSGALVVHAPLGFTDEAAKELDSFGDVRFVIAPACTHWMFVRSFQRRWPKVTVFGAPGLEKKLTMKHGVAFEPLPSGGAIDAIGDELRIQRIAGAAAMNEHVFLHRASASLIVTDLLFNIRSCSSAPMRLFLKLTGTWNKPSQSRMWRFLVKDRGLAAASAAAVLGWDFERVIAAHGEVIGMNARAETARVLEWMVAGGPPQLSSTSASPPVASPPVAASTDRT